MIDYTPTTEEVSIGWAWYKSGWIHSDEIQPQFDRWLAEVIREAKWVGWEEGWDARVNAETITPTENPYRKEYK